MDINITNISSSHGMNFDHIIENLMLGAWENEEFNRKSSHKPVNSGKYKKSPVQSGNAAAAMLLQYVSFEAILRRAYYESNQNIERSYDNDLWKLFCSINKIPKLQNKVKAYYDEITLVRYMISHAYFFKGQVLIDADHKIVGIKERAHGGKHKSQLRKRKTTKLRLCVAPNQLNFKDAAIFYQVTNVLLHMCEEEIKTALWKSKITSEHIYPTTWLNEAMKNLGYQQTKIWQELNHLLSNLDYMLYMEKS